ncbi:MAG: hypothetical protein M9938_00335 [Solirubrobacterales bacterium]|nr:hypothetical protein [Solirubrobacterales bacterium]
MATGPEISLSQPATPREAAAIAAAIQRFQSDTAIAPPPEPTGMDPWLKAALEDGVSAAASFGLAEPFGT